MKLFGNRKRAKHVRSRGRRAGGRGWLIAVCVALVLCGGGFALYRTALRPVERPAQQPQKAPAVQHMPDEPEEGRQPDGAETADDADKADAADVPTEQPVSFRDGVYNILICGTDGDGYRTDTIMIAHLDTNTQQTALMSIPRDTVVPTQSGGIMKINSVYAGGGESGIERLRSRLQTLLGFPVDGYFLVDLEAFEKTVDLLGGVWFDVPQDMYYDDPSQALHIDLKAGYQLLNGKDAMGLVRYRKGYASQDIQRTQVQQEFLRALAKQCMSLKSLTKLGELAGVFAEYVQTDLTVGNMLYFAKELMRCDLDELTTCTVEGEGAMINGISYYPLYDWSILSLVNAYFNPYDTQLTQESIQVITPELAKTYQKPAQDETTPAEDEAIDSGEENPDAENPETAQDDMPQTDTDWPLENGITQPDEPPDTDGIPEDIPMENDPLLWNEDDSQTENR